MPAGPDFAESAIRLGSIWIVDSLKQPGERQTHEELEPVAISQNPSIACERRRVVDRIQFRAALREILKTAGSGVALHIEAHGSAEVLQLSSGEQVEWSELASLTRPTCEASCLNLVVTVAACFGATFTSQVQGSEPAPFLILFGPNRKIHPPGEGLRAAVITAAARVDAPYPSSSLDGVSDGRWRR